MIKKIIPFILPLIIIACSNNQEFPEKFNVKGNPKTIKEISYTAKELGGEMFPNLTDTTYINEYHLDKDRKLYSLKSFFPGMGPERTESIIDKKDNKITWEWKSENGVILYRIVEYKGNSSVSLYQEPDGSFMEDRKDETTYDKDGRIIQEKSWINGAIQFVKYKYDNKGNQIEMKIIFPDVDHFTLLTYKYISFDKAGNWIERVEENSVGKEFGSIDPIYLITQREIEYY